MKPYRTISQETMDSVVQAVGNTEGFLNSLDYYSTAPEVRKKEVEKLRDMLEKMFVAVNHSPMIWKD